MKQEIKQMWTDALRSGRYKQAKGRLRSRHTGAYCCLGVLTNLYLREHGVRPKEDAALQKAIENFGRKNDKNSYPGSVVLKWAGLHHSTCRTLANMNDEGKKKFPDIAEYIEKKL